MAKKKLANWSEKLLEIFHFFLVRVLLIIFVYIRQKILGNIIAYIFNLTKNIFQISLKFLLRLFKVIPSTAGFWSCKTSAPLQTNIQNLLYFKTSFISMCDTTFKTSFISKPPLFQNLLYFNVFENLLCFNVRLCF